MLMKKFCMLLAALMTLAAFVPAMAEESSMEQFLMGDWKHEDGGDHYILFDGEELFYYSTEDSFYYGTYSYVGDDTYLLTDDVDESYTVALGDDLTLSMEGVEGSFSLGYGYWLTDFPYMDEGLWLHDDGATTLLLNLYGDFEFESEEEFLFGTYTYIGSGDFELIDDEGNTHVMSVYDDDSIGWDDLDGYFWLQDDSAGYDPFAYARDDSGDEEDEDIEIDVDIVTDAESSDDFILAKYDADPIDLGGTWYKYGDTSAIPFVLDGANYLCEDSVFGYEVSGTWELSSIAESLDAEETVAMPYLTMESDDGMPGGWDPVLMAGNRLLYSDNKDCYFLHESLVGTDDGANLCFMGDFMKTTWWGADGEDTLCLEFSCMGNAVILNTLYADGGSYSEIVGTWDLQGDCINAGFVDGSAFSVPLPCDTLEACGVEFTK